MRHLIRETAAGKRVLNLFCYTAAFSVYAAAGGAAEIDSVDMSNTYLDWAAVNFALNRFEAARIETAQRRLPRYRLIRADVRSFLARAAGLSWDTIILDPPSFSNSKRMQTDFDLRRDYRELIRRCLDLLSPGGTLWFSANTKGFQLKEEAFPGIIVQDRYPLLIDEDFRGKRIPACYTLSRS
jgi:23S rRNA G2069 N7-methylase RlmK/C1962 C5-methylase RlmI